MSSSLSGLFDLLTQKMSYLNQKQAVLAENVANADTPNYKQLDVKAFSFSDALKQANVGMTVTDPRHIVPASMAGVNAQTSISKESDTSITGNSVDVEAQMMEVSKTSSDYQTVTALYHKMVGLMNIAIKGSAT
jgi:flagellar basal-body rod protein FlgB